MKRHDVTDFTIARFYSAHALVLLLAPLVVAMMGGTEIAAVFVGHIISILAATALRYVRGLPIGASLIPHCRTVLFSRPACLWILNSIQIQSARLLLILISVGVRIRAVLTPPVATTLVCHADDVAAPNAPILQTSHSLRGPPATC